MAWGRAAAAAAWACLLAAAWSSGRPALPALVALWAACLHLGPRLARRLGAAARAALVTCGLAIVALGALAHGGALDWLAPPPDPAAAARAERLRDVARSIARRLKTAEAAWESSRPAPPDDRDAGSGPGREPAAP